MLKLPSTDCAHHLNSAHCPSTPPATHLSGVKGSSLVIMSMRVGVSLNALRLTVPRAVRRGSDGNTNHNHKPRPLSPTHSASSSVQWWKPRPLPQPGPTQQQWKHQPQSQTHVSMWSVSMPSGSQSEAKPPAILLRSHLPLLHTMFSSILPACELIEPI